jgi:hypothetical protein
MVDIDVASSIEQLRRHLPHVSPISVRKLKALYRARDYEGMVRFVRSSMNVEVRLLVGWVMRLGIRGSRANSVASTLAHLAWVVGVCSKLRAVTGGDWHPSLGISERKN